MNLFRTGYQLGLAACPCPAITVTPPSGVALAGDFSTAKPLGQQSANTKTAGGLPELLTPESQSILISDADEDPDPICLEEARNLFLPRGQLSAQLRERVALSDDTARQRQLLLRRERAERRRLRRLYATSKLRSPFFTCPTVSQLDWDKEDDLTEAEAEAEADAHESKSSSGSDASSGDDQNRAPRDVVTRLRHMPQRPKEISFYELSGNESDSDSSASDDQSAPGSSNAVRHALSVASMLGGHSEADIDRFSERMASASGATGTATRPDVDEDPEDEDDAYTRLMDGSLSHGDDDYRDLSDEDDDDGDDDPDVGLEDDSTDSDEYDDALEYHDGDGLTEEPYTTLSERRAYRTDLRREKRTRERKADRSLFRQMRKQKIAQKFERRMAGNHLHDPSQLPNRPPRHHHHHQQHGGGHRQAGPRGGAAPPPRKKIKTKVWI